jgi:hypothetical protein
MIFIRTNLEYNVNIVSDIIFGPQELKVCISSNVLNYDVENDYEKKTFTVKD